MANSDLSSQPPRVLCRWLCRPLATVLVNKSIQLPGLSPNRVLDISCPGSACQPAGWPETCCTGEGRVRAAWGPDPGPQLPAQLCMNPALCYTWRCPGPHSSPRPDSNHAEGSGNGALYGGEARSSPGGQEPAAWVEEPQPVDQSVHAGHPRPGPHVGITEERQEIPSQATPRPRRSEFLELSVKFHRDAQLRWRPLGSRRVSVAHLLLPRMVGCGPAALGHRGVRKAQPGPLSRNLGLHKAPG